MNNFGRPCTQFCLMYTTALYISQEFNHEFNHLRYALHLPSTESSLVQTFCESCVATFGHYPPICPHDLEICDSRLSKIASLGTIKSSVMMENVWPCIVSMDYLSGLVSALTTVSSCGSVSPFRLEKIG